MCCSWNIYITLKNKIHEYITSISKHVYIDKLGDRVKKYNNTYHRTIRMKPVDVKLKAKAYTLALIRKIVMCHGPIQ